MFDYSQKLFFHVTRKISLLPWVITCVLTIGNWFIQSLTILQLWRALFASFEPKVGTLEAQLAGAPR